MIFAVGEVYQKCNNRLSRLCLAAIYINYRDNRDRPRLHVKGGPDGWNRMREPLINACTVRGRGERRVSETVESGTIEEERMME